MSRLPPSPLLRKCEAAIWLRLVDEDADEKALTNAARAVGRLVEEKRLRPIVIGSKHFFALAELEALVVREGRSQDEP